MMFDQVMKAVYEEAKDLGLGDSAAMRLAHAAKTVLRFDGAAEGAIRSTDGACTTCNHYKMLAESAVTKCRENTAAKDAEIERLKDKVAAADDTDADRIQYEVARKLGAMPLTYADMEKRMKDAEARGAFD